MTDLKNQLDSLVTGFSCSKYTYSESLLEKTIDSLKSNLSFNNTYFAIFHSPTHNLLWSSPNFHEFSGHSNKESTKNEFLLDFIHIDHHSFFTENIRLYKKMNTVAARNRDFFASGLKFVKKDGSTGRLHYTMKPFTKNKNSLFLIIFHDITHFLKNNTYILKIKKNAKSIIYNSNKKNYSSSCVSKKQMKIIKLAIKNLTSLKIAKILNCAKSTIDKEKANILNKLGTNSISASYEILRLNKCL